MASYHSRSLSLTPLDYYEPNRDSEKTAVTMADDKQSLVVDPVVPLASGESRKSSVHSRESDDEEGPTENIAR